MNTLPGRIPPVYPIIDTASLETRGVAVEAFASALLDGGARILQFRHKRSFDATAFETARRLSALCAEAGAEFIVNDRADVARLLGAGVHVGQEDLAPADARNVVGSAMVGYSTHNEAQLAAGDREPVDYLAVGPVFGTGSKENPDPVLGLDRLLALRRLTARPLVAIGGITLENAGAALDTGVDSVAVISGLFPPDLSPAATRARMEEWIRLTRK